MGNSCGSAGSSCRRHSRQRRAAATDGTAGGGRQQQSAGATSRRSHQPAYALAPSLHSSRGASVCGRCSGQREGRLAALFGRLAARSQHAGLTIMIARMGTMFQARRTKAVVAPASSGLQAVPGDVQRSAVHRQTERASGIEAAIPHLGTTCSQLAGGGGNCCKEPPLEHSTQPAFHWVQPAT